MTKLEELKVAAWVAALKAATRIEREACAKVCEDMSGEGIIFSAEECAKVIRARGEE